MSFDEFLSVYTLSDSSNGGRMLKVTTGGTIPSNAKDFLTVSDPTNGGRMIKVSIDGFPAGGYTFSTGLTDASGTITANLSTGVAGGQSVIGGTAASNNLTLSSTSNATKGKIIFGTSAYNEATNALGVGTTSPAVSFHIRGTAVGGELAYFLNSANSLGAIFGVSGTIAYLTSAASNNAFAIGINGDTSALYVSIDSMVGFGDQNATSTMHTNGSTGLKTSVSAAGTLTLDDTATTWVFSGTTTTWTLPPIADITDRTYFIKNRGSGAITLNSDSANEIYNNAAGSSLTINAGASAILALDGTYWNVI